MQTGNLFTRDDTFFGVCEGLGQDLGFHPNWLRAALGVLVMWSPVVVLSAYAGAALLVAISRLAFPDPRAPNAVEGVDEPASVTAQNDAQAPELALAA